MAKNSAFVVFNARIEKAQRIKKQQSKPIDLVVCVRKLNLLHTENRHFIQNIYKFFFLFFTYRLMFVHLQCKMTKCDEIAIRFSVDLFNARNMQAIINNISGCNNSPDMFLGY